MLASLFQTAAHAQAAAPATPPAVQLAAADGEATAPGPGEMLRLANYCGVLASTPWPTSAQARRALLQRLEALRQPCIGHAGFLSALGALWLEEGEPAQALLWLERSLMLDPAQLGALADHALALSALGEDAARAALASQWRLRTDIPAALRERLAAGPASQARRGAGVATAAETVARAGSDGWVSYREASLLAGYETNLDHSPRLSELTITYPDGPVTGELDTPFVPRKGGAVIADLSWQVARSPIVGSVVRTGLQLVARHAPGETATDWHHVQWDASVAQRWGAWRAQGHAYLTSVGGALNEPYRLARVGFSVDREAVGCSHRASVEGERRTQRSTRDADGQATAVQWSSLCPWPNGRGDWFIGLGLRATLDEPITDNRPGGRQRHQGVGLRVAGIIGSATRMDATLRTNRVRDTEGYSQLLENNAVRTLHQTQLTLEFSRTIPNSWLPGAEAVLQVQGVRQSSNLALFRYSGVSTYGGLRWRW